MSRAFGEFSKILLRIAVMAAYHCGTTDTEYLHMYAISDHIRIFYWKALFRALQHSRQCVCRVVSGLYIYIYLVSVWLLTNDLLVDYTYYCAT